ncbi:hypothetical protein RM780_14535 [Streptomyces sp. DSM 44917]|uniref:DNA primase/polymerase bifunctional N-terminal domain-containing protein n=1 Tax=Streptomyces boetiae TaxID=3075541 RepID=A0ABU2L9L0_9ACTN|nr:hypothetical protein [Streptomyces sp. DSM 44917]MDT0308171.1 hypothetical protein [Streptomyces sp. DSM 44917]
MNGRDASRAAAEWLAAAAPDPDACRFEWERHPLGVALLPAGRLWDVLVLPGALGRPTLEVLLRVVESPGPVLADELSARVGFFVPPGTACRWLGTGVRSAGPGSWIVVPHPARTANGVRWLIPPDGSGVLTDPAVLELAMHEAAADAEEARAAGLRDGPGGAVPEEEPGGAAREE